MDQSKTPSIALYLKYKQKMRVFIILMALFVISVICNFPITPWRQKTLAFNTVNNYMLQNQIQIIGTNYYVYVPIHSNVGNQVALFKLDATPVTPTMITMKNNIFTNPVQDVVLTVLDTTVIISCQDVINSNYLRLIFDKTTLNLIQNIVVSGLVHGLYIPTYDYLFKVKDQEYLINAPSVNIDDQQGTFSYTTSSPKYIRYIHNNALTKLFTVYTDQSFFFVRDIYASVLTTSTPWVLPAQVTLPSTGCQCACLSADQQILYLLINDGTLLSYAIASSQLHIIIPTGYTGMTDCFYDNPNMAIIFVWQGSDMKRFSLSSLTQVATHNTNMINFWMHPSGTHYIYIDVDTFYVYQVNQGTTCTTGQYWDGAACVPCPTGCATCASSNLCLSCDPGYIVFTALCILAAPPAQNSSSSSPLTLQELLNFLLQNEGIEVANKIPGGRKLFPFFSYLLNIDELWLYQYHEREYGQTLTQVFDRIQLLENEKWRLLEEKTTDVAYSKIGTSKEEVFDFIDTKLNYTSPRFRQREDRGETFLPACWEFITFNLLFILVSFALLKWGFRLLRRYKVSKLLRPFSLLVYLTPLLLDGNLQYFFFLLFAQVRMGFSLNPRDKALNVLNYLVFFFVTWFSVVSCFLAYWLSRRLAEYILDNWRVRVRGLLSFSLANAGRMLVFGALHSLLRDHPAQLPLLLGCQALYTLSLALCMGHWRAHNVAFRVIFTLCFSLGRMAIQLVLIFQQHYGLPGTDSKEEALCEDILLLLLVVYILGIYLAMAWDFVFELIELLKPAKQPLPPNPPKEAKEKTEGAKTEKFKGEKDKDKEKEKKEKEKSKDKKGKESKGKKGSKSKDKKQKSKSKSKKQKGESKGKKCKTEKPLMKEEPGQKSKSKKKQRQSKPKGAKKGKENAKEEENNFGNNSPYFARKAKKEEEDWWVFYKEREENPGKIKKRL